MSGYPTEGDRRRDELLRAQAGLAMPKPAAWRPKEQGETIAGHLVRVEHGEAKYGVYPILVLADADGVEHAVWLMTSVLRVEIEELGPQLGDAVAIVYEGMRKPKGGGDEYHAYNVSLIPAAGSTLDWSNGGRRVAAVAGEQLQVDPRPDAPAPEPPLAVGGPDPAPLERPVGEQRDPSPGPAAEPCPYCSKPAPFHDRDCPADPPPWT